MFGYTDDDERALVERAIAEGRVDDLLVVQACVYLLHAETVAAHALDQEARDLRRRTFARSGLDASLDYLEWADMLEDETRPLKRRLDAADVYLAGRRGKTR